MDSKHDLLVIKFSFTMLSIRFFESTKLTRIIVLFLCFSTEYQFVSRIYIKLINKNVWRVVEKIIESMLNRAAFSRSVAMVIG